MEGSLQKTLRHDWYQSETNVVINVLVKNMKPEDVRVDVSENQVVFTARINDEENVLSLDLLHKVHPSQFTFKVMPSKVEIKLKKMEGIHWSALIKEKQKKDVENIDAKVYPSSKPDKKDWDKIASEIKKEEAEEKLEGDAALNQLFQKIYAEGSEETRRAMNKSFMESGGTVLSTNWNEVGQKKIDVKPPDGMEWKNWTQ